MPLSCGLGHRQTSSIHGLHTTEATHNCGISLKSRIHPPGYHPFIPPLKPATHSDHKPFCLFAWYQIFFFFFCSISNARKFPHIHPLSNPIILHSLHKTEPPEETFINPFVAPYSSFIRASRTLSIILIPSKPLRLSICTVLILDLSTLFISLSQYHTEEQARAMPHAKPSNTQLANLSY